MGNDFNHISASHDYSYVLKNDGSIACWRDNFVGERIIMIVITQKIP